MMAITVSQKSVFRSKTMWASGITIALGLLSTRFGLSFAAGETTTIMGFVFMILRLITNSQIDLTAASTSADVVTPAPVTPMPEPVTPVTPVVDPSVMPEPTTMTTAATTTAAAAEDGLSRIAAAVEQLNALKDYRELVVTIKNPENQGRRF
jgi:hypothetical protein